LHIDGNQRELFRLAPRRHTDLILPMVAELLGEAGITLRELDGLAFGRGPGAFTGVRIACGIIQGFALAADLPVALISSLQALAQGVYRELGQTKVLAAFDARMGEVYWGGFQIGAGNLLGPVVAECVCVPARVPLGQRDGWFGAGSGWGVHREALEQRFASRLVGIDPVRYPHSLDVALLGVEALRQGEVVCAAEALPVYLREEIAHKQGRAASSVPFGGTHPAI
jgi:tRNA threonylcarbamoyladenosine biosynthesis protein TsaB